MYVAAASTSLRPVLAGPARPAQLLGLSRGALYLKTLRQPGVLVVLSHDAVRLPCGLQLATTSAELPLTSLAPHAAALAAARPASFAVGDGAVSWIGPAGPVVVRAVREWAPARPAQGKVAASALAAVRTVAGLSGADPGTDSETVAGLADAAHDYQASVAAAARLLGSGPGLTPSGDDVLTGFLAGSVAFGLDAAALRQAIAALAPARTTALSAALLWHAARGECIDELAAVAALLTDQRPCRPELSSPERGRPDGPGRAVSRLLSVGHTSGAALALGLVIAAEYAVGRRPVRANTVLANTGLANTGLANTGLAKKRQAA